MIILLFDKNAEVSATHYYFGSRNTDNMNFKATIIIMISIVWSGDTAQGKNVQLWVSWISCNLYYEPCMDTWGLWGADEGRTECC